MVCGQTWDLATSNMPYVIGVHRQPDKDLKRVDVDDRRLLVTHWYE